MGEVLIGIDLGGTNVKTALVTRDRSILKKESRPTPAQQGPEAVMDAMAAAVSDLLREAGVDKNDIVAAGIGSPGPLNWQTGMIYETPNLPGWRDVPLAEKMQARLGVPTYLENDANAACFGEFWMGAGKGTECMCALTLGTGVGGGIVVFGQLLRGIDGTAAELGHMTVQRDGRLCGCGSKGCLESYASVTGMVQTAVKKLKIGKDSLMKDLCGNDLSQLTGKMISEAAQRGDELAQSVVRETAVWLGIGIANLVNMLNPEKVILCGGMINAGEMLFDPIRQTVCELAFEVPAKRARILPAGLGADAGVLGAAGCALERHDRDRPEAP